MLTAPHRPTRDISKDNIKIDTCGAELKSEYGLTRIDALPRGIIRVRATRRDAFTKDISPFIVKREATGEATVSVNNESCAVQNGKICAKASLKDGAISVYDGERLLFSEGGLRELEEYTARKIDALAKAVTEEIETADGKKTIVRDAAKIDYKQLYRAVLPLSFSEDEAIYGLGQAETAPLNLRGRKLWLVQTNRTIAIPFFVSTKSYGVLIDCGCPLIFDDEGEKGLIRLSGVTELDYYIIPGAPEEVVKGYHFLSGRPAPLPAWAFGYIQSQERYETQDEIINLVKDYRSKGIGIDCAVEDWMSWPDGMWGQKSFNETRFYDPKGMTEELHKLNARFMISIWPNPNPKTRDNEELKAAGYLLPGGSIYNALLPEARKMYWRQAKEGLYQYGVDAWWCDSSEPWTGEWSHKTRPDDAETYFETLSIASDAVGTDNANAFPFYHAMTMYEGQRGENDDKRVTNLTRSAWTGQQRFGVILWSGDTAAAWETLKNQIAIGLNMSASGFPYWTHDIGGFFVKKGDSWYWDGEYERGWDDPEFRELYLRWYQYAAFLPVFRGHGTDVRRELTNLKGEEFEAAFKYNRLRYRLLPYIYSLAMKTALEGGTIMKPLGFNYPEDEIARDIQDEFLLGDSLLVCPITEYKARLRKVYLPQGKWLEISTGKTLSGGLHEVDAPLDTLPLFVKQGAIIPLSNGGEYAEQALKGEPTFAVIKGADGSFDYYIDALDGYGMEKGEYTRLSLIWDDKNMKLTDKETGKELSYKILGTEAIL